jgi:hypothetical protein
MQACRKYTMFPAASLLSPCAPVALHLGAAMSAMRSTGPRFATYAPGAISPRPSVLPALAPRTIPETVRMDDDNDNIAMGAEVPGWVVIMNVGVERQRCAALRHPLRVPLALGRRRELPVRGPPSGCRGSLNLDPRVPGHRFG